MRAWAVPLMLLVASASAESALIGQPLPPLALDHAVQGDAWEGKDLKGRVALLVVFEPACPSSESIVLPALQRIRERYADDDRLRVVGVSTAFEKGRVPWIAEDGRIQAWLKEKGFTFPIMRDKDEKTVEILAELGHTGSPTLLAMDPSGKVQWHHVGVNEARVKDLEALVERMLDAMPVPPLGDCPKPLQACAQAYAGGDFAKARAQAEAAMAKEGATDEVKEQAGKVLKNLDSAASRQLGQAEAKLETGYPAAALAKLEKASAQFKGLPKAAEIEARLKALKGDKAFQREVQGEKALERLLADAEKKRLPKDARIQALEKLSESLKETKVLSRVQAQVSELKR